MVANGMDGQQHRQPGSSYGLYNHDNEPRSGLCYSHNGLKGEDESDHGMSMMGECGGPFSVI